MQHRKLVLASAVLAATTTTAVLAGSGFKGSHGAMALADTNGDGVVTTEEIQSRHAEQFQAADADNDGALDVDEMQNAMLRWRAQRRVQALDTDGDGKVSAEEYQAPMRWHLSRLDRDDDGEIGREEMRGKRHQRWDDEHDDDRRRDKHRYDD